MFAPVCEQSNPRRYSSWTRMRTWDYWPKNFIITFLFLSLTAQKFKFSIMDFFSKCDQICSGLVNKWQGLIVQFG